VAGGLLVNAVWFVIERLDTEGAACDELARRSTLTPTYEPEITVRGQFKYKQRLSRDADGLSGASVVSLGEGRITRYDAETAGYTPIPGDRITCIIDRKKRRETVNLYVKRANRVSRLPGGWSHWHLEINDRHPARASEN